MRAERAACQMEATRCQLEVTPCQSQLTFQSLNTPSVTRDGWFGPQCTVCEAVT